ncbi:MAG: hypothetical protein H6711_27775 [Myxococcales bacterium]|nr:hypothetical protein [Myxococcales bacterium]
MSIRRAPLGLLLVHPALALALGCSGGAMTSDSAGSATTQGSGFTTTSTSASGSSSGGTSSGESEGSSSAASTGSTDASASAGTSGSSGDATATSTSTGDLSAGSSSTGEPCDPNEDICCLMEGQIPPHKLLDDFLAAYPAANMPKTVAAVQAFEPVADGHAMAWSDENVGNELVDALNGGVIEANILAGRMISRTAAEDALPPGAVVLDVREDPVVIEDLGTPAPCIGVGWAWGSILFEAVDTSIGELVYLYVGFCSNGDVEAFYYSDQAVEICAPIPG